MAEEEEQTEEKKSSKKLIIIIAAVVVLLGGGAGAFFMMGGEEEEVVEGEEEVEEAPKEALYVALDPAFVVNFHDEKGRTKFLKLELNAVTRDPEIEVAVSKHMPMIRNALVLLFSRQTFEELIPHEGKEELRAKALAEMKAVLEREHGSGDIEDVLFTSFVMQ